jgi:hypothetical protein
VLDHLRRERVVVDQPHTFETFEDLGDFGGLEAGLQKTPLELTAASRANG